MERRLRICCSGYGLNTLLVVVTARKWRWPSSQQDAPRDLLPYIISRTLVRETELISLAWERRIQNEMFKMQDWKVIKTQFVLPSSFHSHRIRSSELPKTMHKIHDLEFEVWTKWIFWALACGHQRERGSERVTRFTWCLVFSNDFIKVSNLHPRINWVAF